MTKNQTMLKAAILLSGASGILVAGMAIIFKH